MLKRFIPLMIAALCATGCGNDEPAPAETGGPALGAGDVALNNRGVALMGSFDYAAARDVFRQVVDRQPEWLDAKVNLAIATLNRQSEGDEARALSLVSEVLAEDPGHLRAHYVSGLLKLYLGAMDTAADHFRSVVTKDPGDAYAAYYLAQCVAHTDHEAALKLYEQAIESDPYLRSAYYGSAQVLRQLGRSDEAREMLEVYQRFANNPRAQLAKFEYTKMGPRGNALAAGMPGAERAVAPEGPLFNSAVRMATLDGAAAGMNLTVVDIDNDGLLEIFASGPGGSVLLAGAEDERVAVTDHPLVRVGGVVTAAWGDVDNDGVTDVYLCREAEDQLWLGRGDGRFRNVTAAAGIASGGRCADASLLDADHDGDLDILVARASGGAELYNNNLDGSFRRLAGERGLEFGDRPARQFLAADLDNDRDTDLILIRAEPPHAVFLNDRLWEYRQARGLDGLLQARIVALSAGDLDANGERELYAALGSGELARWQRDAGGDWSSAVIGAVAPGPVQLAVGEFDGDGRKDLLVRDSDGWRVLSVQENGTAERFRGDGNFSAVQAVVDNPGRGPGLVAVADVEGRAEIHHWPPGTGRGRFAAFEFSGKEVEADSMRSNRSGIGTHVAVRTGSLWSMADMLDRDSGPGQSLQPLAMGVGDSERIDYIAVNWSDGVFQTELDLPTGALHEVAETQRQLSSCPVVFAWDGQGYRFVSDVLGVGGIGFLIEPGRYATPRPWEYFLLPENMLVARDGAFEIKITEPMEEIAYIDSARLHVYDLQPGWDMVLDERMATGAPEVTGKPFYFRRSWLPARAFDSAGEDVRERLLSSDGRAVSPGETDRRFIGRMREPHSVTLEFDRPLTGEPGRPVLVADGWVEYPYSQTVFAAWQAGAKYRPPALEARTADGDWVTVYEAFGYPAGMPRRMALPLDALPEGTVALRLSSTLQLYWDRLAVVFTEEPGSAVSVSERPLRAAEVERIGFPQRIERPQRRPDYDFGTRASAWDSRHLTGYYTAFGDALPLLAELDDAFAIIGPGESLHLEFVAGRVPSAGSRRYVLETRGFAKDMDLYTRTGGSVEPLPSSGVNGARRDALHERYNTRFEAGY